MLNAIVAVDNNFGIGYNNELLFHIPEDMKFFKKITMGNTVVMGRKTFDSIGKPLAGRTNVVITSKFDLKNIPDLVSGSMEEIERFLTKYKDENVFIIGGSTIYKHFMEKYDNIYLTSYDYSYKNIDSYFPNPKDYGYHEVERLYDGVYKASYFKIARLTK